jgi:hypothetical protein
MFYRLHGVTVESAIPLPELPRASGRRAAVAIELAREAADLGSDWYQTWRVRNKSGRQGREPWLSFARQRAGYLLRFQDLADFEVSSRGDRICCRPASRLARSTLRHLLIDQVLPLALSQRGHLVLHASAVHVPGVGAIAFAGPAGCGKSTVAAALAIGGCRILTDDCLVVAPGAETISAVPGYPGLRLWRRTARALELGSHARQAVAHYTAKRRLAARVLSFRNRPSPLRALFVLGRRVPSSTAIRTQALRARDGLVALAPYAYVMDVGDRRQVERMFSNLSDLVVRVPVARLRLRDDRRGLRDVADEVLTLTSR